jgi:hypothetical protein
MNDRKTSLPQLSPIDWTAIGAELDREGYTILSNPFSADQARELGQYVRQSAAQHKRRSLEAVGLGRGSLWRLASPLPDALLELAEHMLVPLTHVAERWSALSTPLTATTSEPIPRKCNLGRGGPADAIVTKLCEGDYQALHQHVPLGPGFPLQLVILLSDPEVDFQGGEFVMTEQRPRMQSRPMVLPLKLGDIAVLAVARRPFKGTKGYYGVNMKHAISRVRSGERLGAEVVFHPSRVGLTDV